MQYHLWTPLKREWHDWRDSRLQNVVGMISSPNNVLTCVNLWWLLYNSGLGNINVCVLSSFLYTNDSTSPSPISNTHEMLSLHHSVPSSSTVETLESLTLENKLGFTSQTSRKEANNDYQQSENSEHSIHPPPTVTPLQEHHPTPPTLLLHVLLHYALSYQLDQTYTHHTPRHQAHRSSHTQPHRTEQ